LKDRRPPSLKDKRLPLNERRLHLEEATFSGQILEKKVQRPDSFKIPLPDEARLGV
jgi:hypothetical protein